MLSDLFSVTMLALLSHQLPVDGDFRDRISELYLLHPMLGFKSYRLSTNLVIYLMRRMGTDPATASIQQMLFEGTCYITPLLGAWLADSHWGRYKTILVFSLIYLLVGTVIQSFCISQYLC